MASCHTRWHDGTREIGVRIASGADRIDVIKMVLRQGFVLACIGIGLGRPNPATFIVVPSAVLLVTMAACWAPAWRASRVDPLRTLRSE
jgi:ABC-type antimicrobial peptide transport system permease subunit